jgi:ribosomal protein S1
VAKATPADIKADVSVYDEAGDLVGKVVSVSSDGAVVNTGKVRAQIPLSSFGKNDKGLVVSATKADLDAQAKKEPKPKI